MSKTAVVFLAEGTEEMEFSITYDVLVRGGVKARSIYVPAEGAPASPPNGMITASRGVKLGVDMTLAELEKEGLSYVDALVVPGGVGGAQTISKNPIVLRLLQEAYEQGKIIGMICAGSLAALEAQIGLQGTITSHPSIKDKLSSCMCVPLTTAFQYQETPVAVAGPLVTSRGPGTTFAFALTLVEKLMGVKVREEITPPMMLSQEHL
ncbi:protein deglycase [Malassezia nana]|uniref:D-lactate dehydratase n=1 Tax=Malassezia nana TaxID=180528 RepID=A0AAF0J3Y6_9BASI|nr:protein deglycase [Malassezia nana]